MMAGRFSRGQRATPALKNLALDLRRLPECLHASFLGGEVSEQSAAFQIAEEGGARLEIRCVARVIVADLSQESDLPGLVQVDIRRPVNGARPLIDPPESAEELQLSVCFG